MKKNLSDYLVALTVMACSLVLLGALTYALGGWKAKGSGRTLEADFVDVTGIKLHTEVRYAGAPAGSVTAIRHLSEQERRALPEDRRKNAVRVSMELHDQLPQLPDDVQVTISSDTLLSDKFIALSGGSPEAPRLANASLLQGHSGGSIDDLVNAVGPFLEKAEGAIAGIEPLLKKTNETVASIKSGVDDVMPRLGAVADAAKQTALSADGLMKRADRLIADAEGPVKADLVELRATLEKMQETLKSANSLLARSDKNLDGRMREMSEVLQNLKVASSNAKVFTQAIAEKPNRLLFSGSPKPLPGEASGAPARPAAARPAAR